jgi:hypothetical protein
MDKIAQLEARLAQLEKQSGLFDFFKKKKTPSMSSTAYIATEILEACLVDLKKNRLVLDSERVTVEEDLVVSSIVSTSVAVIEDSYLKKTEYYDLICYVKEVSQIEDQFIVTIELDHETLYKGVYNLRDRMVSISKMVLREFASRV